MTSSWQLLKYLLRRHPAKALATMLIAVAVVFSSVGLLATSAWLITFCALTPMIAEILVPVVYVRLFGLLRGILRYCERLISHETTFRLLGDLRTTLYRAISRRPLQDILHLDHRDAFGRLVDDIERLQDFYLRTFNPAITAFLTALFGFFLVNSWGHREAVAFVLIYLLTLLVLPAMVYFLTAGLSRRIAVESSEMRSYLFEFLAGLAEIRTAGAQNRWNQDLNSRQQQLEKTETRLANSKSLASGWIAFAAPLTAIAVVWLGGQRVMAGELNPLFLPVELFAVLALFEAVQPIPTLLQKIETSRLAAGRVIELIDPEELPTKRSLPNKDLQPHEVKHKSWPADLKLTLEGVCCRYPGQRADLLHDLNLNLGGGRKIAVVGSSGSGKTTLLYLLLGWLEPTAGQLRIQSKSVADISPRGDYFAVVNQDVYLFNTSVRNNLRIGGVDAADKTLLAALQNAGLTAWLESLPNGLNTELGEGDNLLSGGQRQRLGLARALLRPAPFLVLDEATAGIDVLTEKHLMKTIFATLTDQRSGILTITHRLVAMDHYDEIIVLDQGRIAERGDHLALLQKRGLYFRMWQLQQAVIPDEDDAQHSSD